ncbi:MAG TPA: HAD family acid phosphatase [Actinomycetota bacterium]|jgi:predicted secreted acid phosphatase|nr:HAD family acid phosphatase [Actinomycetota bacterium]
MNGLPRPRRSLWLGIGLGVVLVVLAAAAAVAIAGLQPADLTYTPNSESQMTNIDVSRAYAKNYYGAPTATSGAGGTWNTPLNQDSNYANEARSVAKQGDNWLSARSKVADKAIVLDVDDTTLTTWNYELYSNWDFNPTTNAQFVGLTGSTFTGNAFPATPGMVDMVSDAKAMGYAIFFLTGRGDSQHQATIANLVSDTAAGLPDLTTVTISGKTVPEIDAGYPMPTPLDIQHGGFTDGLFTKPPVGQYPAYLNKPQFCGPSITAGVSCPTIQYKSGVRAYIESQGYDIVGNFGDQFSDLLNGFADKTFKMPNPNYYLP